LSIASPPRYANATYRPIESMPSAGGWPSTAPGATRSLPDWC
jgi:hypothetical protein